MTQRCSAICSANGRRCSNPPGHDGLHDFIDSWCPCGNRVENRWGTCDECQDAAYCGDGFARW